jgi:hypothetical protein
MLIIVKAVLPVLLRVATWGELVTPPGSLPNVRLDGETLAAAPEAGLMVIVNVAVPAPAVFDALRVTVEVPAAVGVPEISPVVVFTVRPVANPVAP